MTSAAPEAAVAAFNRAVDAQLSNMQRSCLAALGDNTDEARASAGKTLISGSGQLAALACFATNPSLSRQCRNIRRYVRLIGSEAGRAPVVVKRLLWTIVTCRELLSRQTAKEQLRLLLLAKVQRCIAAAAATDAGSCTRLKPRQGVAESPDDSPTLMMPATWLRQNWPLYVDVQRAGGFLPGAQCQPCSPIGSRTSVPQDLTAVALLKSLLHLQSSLAGEVSEGAASDGAAGVASAVDWQRATGLEVGRYLHTYQQALCPGHEIDDVERVRATRVLIWDLIQLASAVLSARVASSSQHCNSSRTAELASAIIIQGGVILHLDTAAGAVDPENMRRLLKLALLMKTDLLGETVTQGAEQVLRRAPAAALPALPADLATALQLAFGDSKDLNLVTADWRELSMHCYQLLVRLRMLGGGYTDSLAAAGTEALKSWRVLMGSIYRCIGYCEQLPLHSATAQEKLLRFLKQLPLLATGRSDSIVWQQRLLMLEARLAVTAARYWQSAVLELDAEQDDFNGQSVHQALASGLRLLPAASAVYSVQDDARQDVLRELRFLLKGARVLGIQRIESLVWVMIEACQAQPPPPEVLMRRAHRSLCRMLDQAAAWQPPGSARRMINSLYSHLEGLGSRTDQHRSLRELAGSDNSYQQCLRINWRLRKILRHSRDLDSVRVLLQELLRSQEDMLSTSVHYASASAAGSLGVSGVKRL